MNLYLLKMRSKSSEESFYKIGVTHHSEIERRFLNYESKLLPSVQDSDLPKFDKVAAAILGVKVIFPYSFDVVYKVDFAKESDARRVEGEILQAVRKQPANPQQKFSGHTECFIADETQIGLVIKYMNDEAKTCSPGA